MKKYKQKNLKLMVYLQPMIMWSPNPKTDRERQAVKLSADANTRTPFRTDSNTSLPYKDQHHLGHAGWQRWFLDWVKEYIQGYGANGIYHDQSYLCPIDARGLAGGMTTTQDNGRLILPANYRESFNKREPSWSHIVHSDDHGKTWKVGGELGEYTNECQVEKLIYGGSAAYSCLARLPDGKIGVVYERDGYGKLTFTSFALDWLDAVP